VALGHRPGRQGHRHRPRRRGGPGGRVWRIEGIHRGTVFGVPGTGKAFTGTSISTLTFRDGKVVRYTVLPDRLGIIKQLGGAPA
jgi:SnoaL-like polyketide cyclase